MTVMGFMVKKIAVQQRVEVAQTSPGLYCRIRISG